MPSLVCLGLWDMVLVVEGRVRWRVESDSGSAVEGRIRGPSTGDREDRMSREVVDGGEQDGAESTVGMRVSDILELRLRV